MRLNAKLTGFRAPLSYLRGSPAAPETADANSNACGSEANQNSDSVTLPGLKQRLQVMFLASEAISEHQIFQKNFPGQEVQTA